MWNQCPDTNRGMKVNNVCVCGQGMELGDFPLYRDAVSLWSPCSKPQLLSSPQYHTVEISSSSSGDYPFCNAHRLRWAKPSPK